MTPRARLLLIVPLILLAACSTAVEAGSPSPSAVNSDRGGVPPGYPMDVDLVSPLIITTVAPDPIPVAGTDGKVHVVYELEVVNFSPRLATITSIETLAGGPEGPVVSSVDGDEVTSRSLLLAGFGEPYSGIPVGRSAVVLLDDVFARRADVPAGLTHRVTASFGAPGSTDLDALAARYPDSVTQIGGPVRVSDQEPVVIGPPLSGDDWGAGNGCCALTSHRGAMMATGGRLTGAERFAIDWVKFDTAADPVVTFSGDISRNEDYLAYGADVIAVADGTVVSVESHLRDEPPLHAPTDIGLAQLGGNSIILDIGDGNYVFLAHLVPGSAMVKAGDKVVRGQVLGRLGNSGNTTEAHLHLHVSRAPLPLSGDNVPFVIDRFSFVGSVGADSRFVAGPNAGERTGELPLDGAVVDFPASP